MFFVCAAPNSPLVNRRADIADVVTRDSVTYSVARSNVYAQAGQTVSIRCLATGTPTPTITWQKDGTDVTDISGLDIGPDGTLDISNFDSDDVGLYTCTATSGSESDSQQIQVSLLGTYGKCEVVIAKKSVAALVRGTYN